MKKNRAIRFRELFWEAFAHHFTAIAYHQTLNALSIGFVRLGGGFELADGLLHFFSLCRGGAQE